MSKLNWWLRACSISLLWAATAIASSAQTYTTLHSFAGYPTDGGNPMAALVQGTDGNFYGTASSGGISNLGCYPGCGTVYKITPAGNLFTLHSFCVQSGCPDGNWPTAPLVLGTDGNFYGTTGLGGATLPCLEEPGCGTVFKITPGGTLTTLHSFDGTDGYYPNGLVQATGLSFYGTTQGGGANNGGTVFKVTADGTFTTIYNFCSQTGCTDGAGPSAALVQGTNGDFYGTTAQGGAFNIGTIFTISPSGKLTTLDSFGSGIGGEYPTSALVLANDGNFYGNTHYGEGYIFKITPRGTPTNLGGVEGFDYAGLIQGTNGKFYGNTYTGGLYGGGIVFSFSVNSGGTGGTLTTLYNFCSQTNCIDGGGALGSLVQGTDGTFYGTTVGGGAMELGTVFSLSVGLHAFVETLPTSGKAGTRVTILGNNLTGTTGVTFNGTPAILLKVTNSAITTAVPSGATSGKVQVVTPSGTLSSNVPFRVTP